MVVVVVVGAVFVVGEVEGMLAFLKPDLAVAVFGLSLKRSSMQVIFDAAGAVVAVLVPVVMVVVGPTVARALRAFCMTSKMGVGRWKLSNGLDPLLYPVVMAFLPLLAECGLRLSSLLSLLLFCM